MAAAAAADDDDDDDDDGCDAAVVAATPVASEMPLMEVRLECLRGWQYNLFTPWRGPRSFGGATYVNLFTV